MWWLVDGYEVSEARRQLRGGPAESKQYADAVKFSHCMRAHGVSQFPDPSNPGGFSNAAIDALNTSSPAFNSATNTCDSLLPNEGQPTPADFEQGVVNGVKVASACALTVSICQILESRGTISRST